MELPPFDALTPNYPVDTDPQAVKAAIGGQVDADFVTNTCVLRISKAFNYAGASYHIPRTDGGLFTLRGADGLSYALRVREFIEFLRAEYGPPDIVALPQNNAISSAPFIGSRGIIAWHVSGWNDATGHFTLWDDDHGLYEGDHDYFAFPTVKPAPGGPWLTKVEFWRC